MRKARAILIAIVVIAAVIGAAFVLGVGPFAGDGDQTQQNNSGEDTETTIEPDQSTDTQEIDPTENVTVEEVRQMYEERYKGPGDVPQFYNDMETLDTRPPGVSDRLDYSTTARRTLAETANSSFAWNFYQVESNPTEGIVSHIGSKYNAERSAGLKRIFRAGQTHTRSYSTSDSAVKQTIDLSTEETEQQSIASLPTKEYLSVDRLGTFIEPAIYEPVGWTQVNGYDVVVLQADFLGANARERLATQMGRHVAEIKAYGGEVYIGEFGSLLEAEITIIYETRDGETAARVIQSNLVFGETAVEKPSWAEEDTLDQAAGDPVELVNNQYLRLQPEDEKIPANATIELTTPAKKYVTTLPKVDVGEVAYVYLKDNELVASESEPDTDEFIGVDYQMLIIDEDRLVMTADSG